MFDPSSRSLNGFCINKDAGPDTVPNACEGGQEGEQEDQRWPPSRRYIRCVSREMKIPSPEDKSKGEANVHSPHGKKGAIPEDWGEKAPKRGKTPLSGGSGLEDDVIAQTPGEGKPKS